jgi:hypothetical protein
MAAIGIERVEVPPGIAPGRNHVIEIGRRTHGVELTVSNSWCRTHGVELMVLNSRSRTQAVEPTFSMSCGRSHAVERGLANS